MSTTYATAPGRAPGVGHALALMRGPLGFIQSLRSHGDLVRVDLGPMPALFVTEPELIHALLTDRKDLLDKGRFYDKVRPLTGNGVIHAYGDEHRRQRAMIKPSFHREQIARYATVMHEVTTRKTADWRAGEQLPLDKAMRDITFNILASTMFGSAVGKEAHQELADLLPVVLEAIMWRTVSPGDLLEKLPLPMNRRFDRAFADLRAAISRVMLEYRRSEDGERRADMLSMLLGAKDEDTGLPMTDEEICNQIVSITMAGSETAATAMAWMFYELDRHPDIERRVRAEVLEVLGDRDFEVADAGRLPYCRTVLQEVLRVRQPILVISRRAVQDFPLGSGTVRAGTELFYSPYAVHRDPEFFPDPLRFDPDRWVSRPAAVLPKGAYTPFGAGPRHCIGEQFAWAMMHAVLAIVVRRWRLVLPDGVKVREMPWATVNPHHMPMVPVPVGREESVHGEDQHR
ncbi:cytochrome P450 [Streptomyces sp. N2-109]|uniref:Cytochrome P450 n=1 Tax=Streptomyces gossypii TaxID=2883101 RepID=A0ABT2K0Y0_9ACTN|nr:cytochrome P450 [Streptomyces gossypii]MCT2593284.1 cytochrome P450 [Streptomyces gossypii]